MKITLKDLRHSILYGFVLAVLIFSLKWFQWKYLIIDNAIDIYIGLIALFFTGLGVWVASQLARPKVEKVFIEKEILIPQGEEFVINEIELKKLSLTKREYEILQLISKGQSNSDIAKGLFLSISTVKSHVSNLYTKMNVKSRTQAIAKAKRLKITP